MRPLDPTKEGKAVIIGGFCASQPLVDKIGAYYSLRKKASTKQLYMSGIMRDLVEAGLKAEARRLAKAENDG